MRLPTTIALVTTAALTAASAPAALAHAPIDSRTPAPGKTVSHVKSVNITFGDAVVTGLISVSKGSTPVKAKTSGLNSKKTVLRETFSKALSKGTYTVSWRALADDGHHQKGTWTFKVR